MGIGGWRLGLVGATGMVGQAFLKILEERSWPLSELRLFASEQSLGKKLRVQSKEYSIETLKPGCFEGLDLVFFSSGEEVSLAWAPRAAHEGAWVVDNSSAFRMQDGVPLVVPEVNINLLEGAQWDEPQIIANPNCTTIQLVLVLNPLMKAFGLREVRLASYQALSGGGQEAVEKLRLQTREALDEDLGGSPRDFAFNCLPQIGTIDSDGYSAEDRKVIRETKKILGRPELLVSAFTVRVPVRNAHCEVVWITLEKEISREEFLGVLQRAPGLYVMEGGPGGTEYPVAREVDGKDEVFVGRVHRDLDHPYTWLVWIVADNIRKGAALNGIQIGEAMGEKRGIEDVRNEGRGRH